MADTYGMQNLLLELAVAENLESKELLPKNRLQNINHHLYANSFHREQHSIASILTYWCESLKGQVKASTYLSYTYQVEHALIPYLGGKAAEEFHERSMAEFLEKYQKEGRENKDSKENRQDGKCASKPSESTLYLLEVILRRAFLHAVNQGILSENPLGRLQMRPCQDAELTVLPAEAVDSIKRKLATKPALVRMEILLPLYTGCILSELCALSWKDINLEKKELYIRKNLLRVRDMNQDSRAKTVLQLAELAAEEQRMIHIPEILVQELYVWKDKGVVTEGQAYLLTGTETYLNPRTYQKHIIATLAECGIEEGSLTMLRDTYVVMCLECGAGEYSLAKQLGIETGRLITRYHEYLQPDYSFLQSLR